MLMKFLKRDLFKKKTINVIFLVFVMLSAFLMCSSARMITELIQSLNYFFIKTDAPHFVQLASNKVSEIFLEGWSKNNNFVKNYQLVEMLNIPGGKVYLGDNRESEEFSIMNLDFVTQNKKFDFLLNMKNKIIRIKPTEIAVPIYFMLRDHLKIGDYVNIKTTGHNYKFKIVAFLRDVQMNPSIIHSKRFLINQKDFLSLEKVVGSFQYLIEFKLKNKSDISQFTDEYQRSGMPSQGPSINYQLFKILNSITDGIVIGILILVGVLLIVVSMLCLRFILMITLEEDYRQIGVMKALGIEHSFIRKVYLIKYIVIGALASFLGLFVSALFVSYFTKSILLYLGPAPSNTLLLCFSVVASILVFLIVFGFSLIVLRRFKRVTPLEGLRNTIRDRRSSLWHFLSLRNLKLFRINFALPVRDVLQKYRVYFLLLFVFSISVFIVIVPINLYNTISSNQFITYMGVGRSQVRIDLREFNHTDKYLGIILRILKNDLDVSKYSVLTTSRFKFIGKRGGFSTLKVDSGDFSIFPIKYLEGTYPVNKHELALSYLNAKKLDLKFGDNVTFFVKDKKELMKVSGIYQDITNGGETAKAILMPNEKQILWYVINIDFKQGVDIAQKINRYKKEFYPARVTDLKEYLKQTLSGLISQIKSISFLIMMTSIILSSLIVSLFLKMLIARNASQISIFRALGFSIRQMRAQYFFKMILLLVIGIIFGCWVSSTLGQLLVSLVWSFMGAPEIKFVIKPMQIYFLVPLTLIVVVTVMTFLGTSSISKITMADMFIE